MSKLEEKRDELAHSEYEDYDNVESFKVGFDAGIAAYKEMLESEKSIVTPEKLKAAQIQIQSQAEKIEQLEERLKEAVGLISEFEKRFSIHMTKKSLSGCPKCRCQIYTKKRSINNPTCECVACGFAGEDWQFEPHLTKKGGKG